MPNIRQQINQLRVGYFQPAPHVYGKSFSGSVTLDPVCNTIVVESPRYGSPLYRTPCVAVTARVSPMRSGPGTYLYIPNAGVTLDAPSVFSGACYPNRTQVNDFTSIDNYSMYVGQNYCNAYNLHNFHGYTMSPFGVCMLGFIPMSF